MSLQNFPGLNEMVEIAYKHEILTQQYGKKYVRTKDIAEAQVLHTMPCPTCKNYKCDCFDFEAEGSGSGQQGARQ